MGKVGTGFSMSLDGFIAGLEGDVGRLDAKQIELERTRVVETSGATHLRFRVVKEG